MVSNFAYYTERDVERALNMSLAIDAMEEAFRALASGKADNVPRTRARAKGIVLHSMSAAAEYLGLVGWKQYTTTASGARFHVGVYDQQTGELVALIEADRLGQMRTGAVTGLAARHLAPEGADEVAMIGTGWQAESQLAAVAAALPLRRAFCYSRNTARRQAFAQRMTEKLGLEVQAVDDAEAAVRTRPLVVAATSSTTPVLDGSWLAPTALVCAVGSNWLKKSELDVATVKQASLVVCDSIRCCQEEAGDFVQPLAEGAFRWEDAVELADVVAGHVASPRPRTGSVVFKSVGMAIEDVAMAALLLKQDPPPKKSRLQ